MQRQRHAHLYDTCPAHSSALMPRKGIRTFRKGSKGMLAGHQGQSYHERVANGNFVLLLKDSLIKQQPGASSQDVMQ